MEAEFRSLMQRVRAGSPEAAAKLLEDFGPQLIRVVRRSLDDRLRSKFDSADFVQAVWGSFFANAHRLQAFESPEQLVGFLSALAKNKVVDEFRRRLRSQKHNVLRETPLATTARDEIAAAPARAPTPSQVAIAKEQWDLLVAGLPVQHRRIIELRYAGAKYGEIAEALGVHQGTARRIMDRLFRERFPQ